MKSLNRWVYAIVGVIVLLMAGLVYAWSVMSQSIKLSRPDWTQSQLSTTFTIVMAFFCVGCLIAGFLSKKVAPRVYLIISGILFVLGFFVASRTGASPIILYLGFGVLCGLGSGFAYNAIIGTISMWFPDKQGLISGIMLMGFGFSAFIIGKVFAAVTPTDGSDGWKSTFLVMGVIILVVMIVASFFIFKPGADYKVEGGAKKKEVRQPAVDVNTATMVKYPSFWFYYIWAILISAAGLVLVSQANGIAREVGTAVSDGNIATVVGLISIMNGIGRVFFGGLFDKVGYKKTMLLCMSVFIIDALILIAALKSGNFVLVILGFVVGGFAYSGVTPTNSAIISDFFGRTNFSLNFSLINTNLLIASFASTIAGKLYDSTQSFFATIIMMIVVTVVGFVVFLLIKRPERTK